MRGVGCARGRRFQVCGNVNLGEKSSELKRMNQKGEIKRLGKGLGEKSLLIKRVCKSRPLLPVIIIH